MNKVKTDFDALMAALLELPGMPPIERAQAARRLNDTARSVLTEVRDAAIVEARETLSWAQIAAELDLSEASVNKAITQHRRRVNGAIDVP